MLAKMFEVRQIILPRDFFVKSLIASWDFCFLLTTPEVRTQRIRLYIEQHQSLIYQIDLIGGPSQKSDLMFDLIWYGDLILRFFDAKMYTISLRFTLMIKTPGPGRTINIRVYTTFTIGEILFSSSGARSDRFHWGEASFYLKETHSRVRSMRWNVILPKGNAFTRAFNEVKRHFT